MARLLIGTNYVSEDEPCLGLAELVKLAPDSRGLHRYQIITVIRNDKQVDYRKDLGLASNYKADQFIVPGGVTKGGKGEVVETVGRLRDIADQVRNAKLWDKKQLAQNNNIREKY